MGHLSNWPSARARSLRAFRYSELCSIAHMIYRRSPLTTTHTDVTENLSNWQRERTHGTAVSCLLPITDPGAAGVRGPDHLCLVSGRHAIAARLRLILGFEL